jgi:glycogen debranching enzyme
MIAFGPDVCRDWSRATSREWLETNGLGGYASSTIIGANTRRYHGLLIAALRPPSQRTLLLSKLEDTLVVGDTDYDLSCNQYPGAIYPQGYRYLAEFSLDPFPTSVYELPLTTDPIPFPPPRARGGGDQGETDSIEETWGGVPVRLQKTVAMCRGLDAVIVRYRLVAAPGPVSLVIRPIVNCRDHHHLMRRNASFETRCDVSDGQSLASIEPFPGVPALRLHLAGARFEAHGDWYHNFEYVREQERGLDYTEDQYSPGYFSCRLQPGESRHFVAWLAPLGAGLVRPALAEFSDPAAALEAEAARRKAILAPWAGAPEGLKQLGVATDAFLVGKRRGVEESRSRGIGAIRDSGFESCLDSRLSTLDSSGVIAGYHWFEEWGRDAMIALPGLALVAGRFDAAKRILQAYAANRRDGLIPNRIPNTAEEPDYNTADASLWMFWAAHKYLDYTGDRAFVRSELLPVLAEIIQWHAGGTRFGIRAEQDGLLRAGAPGSQLTWMDAKVGDWLVTPRHGKPVEINALWHHALRFVEELGAAHAGPSAELVGQAFRARFWNEDVGYLNDVVDITPDGPNPESRISTPDASLRPNQVIALSLPYPILEPERARRALATVERELLTPFGLRTLSPRAPRYRGRYAGDQWSRDSAYHQGTVWPWLLGPFITAYTSFAEDKAAARRTARAWLEPMWQHLREAGLGFVSEVFDGDQPHQAGGCIAQAWSVAEILRAAVEDLGLRAAGV